MMQSNDVARSDLGAFGARLKEARLQAGLSLDQVSTRLHIPRRVLEALEADRHEALGAPVFVRGQLRSYARLVGVDLGTELDTSPVAKPEPVELVSHVHTPRYRRLLEQTTRRAVYVVITVAIAVPVWLATRPHLGRDLDVRSLDTATLASPPGSDTAPASAASGGNASGKQARAAAPARERAPLVASLTPMASDAGPKALVLRFEGESWMKVQDAAGRTLESGLVPAGETRRYDPGEAATLVIGNVSAVEVRHEGRTVDLAPFSRANVARFTLSSDGSLTPVDH